MDFLCDDGKLNMREEKLERGREGARRPGLVEIITG